MDLDTRMLQKLSTAIALTALMSLGVSGKVLAVSLTESVDAGEFLVNAQQSNSQPAGTPLDSISGSINAGGDIDLYQIFIPGGVFSASTVGSTGINSVLYLFDSNGLGVFANDDAFPSFQSTISVASLPQGTYYLGISTSGYEPQSSGGAIFDFVAADPTGPNGPGAGAPLSSWSPEGFPETGTYTIGVTGAQFVGSTAAVPFDFNPAFGVTIVAIWTGRKYLKKRKQ